MPIDEERFKKTMGRFNSGVTIVTTEHEGSLLGMTVASFASLSLRPPLILVCIEKSVRSHDVLAVSGRFGVSVLAAGQEELSNRFASRIENKFEGVTYRTGGLGVPLIEGAIAQIECRTFDQLEGGDHTIFVGEVESAEFTDGAPLVYFRGGYRGIAGL